LVSMAVDCTDESINRWTDERIGEAVLDVCHMIRNDIED
jgi:hypothetical protein